ncbi:uncharacterized protein [Antedon mediterranea]|uniref:uncharacterized protein n=1 Tax=Antedon mediterranea TaxID=105859 RepID=UPI003AF6C046
MCNLCSNPLPCPIDPCNACTSIPRGAECRVDTCTSCIAELYDSDGTKIGECPDTMQQCSPGLPYVPCLHDPCQGIVCPGYTEAVCKATYCGKCNYEFVDPASGDRVECNACPNNEPVYRCASDPCATATCSAHPDAVCQVIQCGSCSAEFLLSSGEVADCTDYCKENKCRYGSKCHSISAGYFCECPAFKRGEFCEEDFCERNGHTYTIGETLDSDDECNKCICGKEGAWKCTEKRCGSTCIDRGQTYYAGDQRDSEDGCNTCGTASTDNKKPEFKWWSTIVELTFHLDYNFANIEDDIETFKQSLRLDLAKQLSLPVTSLRDFRLSPGSIVVEFKLVSSDELAETDVTQVAADIVKQLDNEYIFTFDGQDIMVIPDTVTVISEPEAIKKNNTNLELIIGVTAGAVGLIAAVIIFLIIRNKRRKECKLPTTSKKTSTYPNANFVPDAVN